MKYQNIIKKIIIIFIIIFIINIILIKYIGNRYLLRLNTFIKENNNIIIRNEISNYLRNNKINNPENLYIFKYNKDKEIIDVEFNMNNINLNLNYYIENLNKRLLNISYDYYINNYYKNLKTKNNIYILLPLGMISDNPFLYNKGPNVIMSYEVVSNNIYKIILKITNYGLNNALVETYLNIEVNQSIVKPILKNITKYNYNYLISSNIINGRVSNFLSSNIEKDVSIKTT